MNMLSPPNHVRRHPHSPPARLTRTEQSYLFAYLVSLIVCLSPLKAAAYLTPFLAIFIFVLLSQKIKPGLRFGIMVFFAITLVLLNAVNRDGFVLHSGLYTIITYGSFLFIAAIPIRTVGSPRLFERMIPWIKRVVVLEAILGITQWLYNFITKGGFYPFMGDVVDGTIAPGMGSVGALSHQMLTINLVFLLLGLLYWQRLNLNVTLIFAMGLITLVLASVMHVLIFLVLALLGSIFLFMAKGSIKKPALIILVVVGGIGLLTFLLYPTQVSHIYMYGGRFMSVRIPKAVIAVESVTVLPEEYPAMPIVGLGPGQFTSRAALIGTGMYYQNINVELPSGMSKAFREYVLHKWLAVREMESAGSTWKPFSSWISFYTEFGAIATIILILWLRKFLRRVIKAAWGIHYRQGLIVATGTLFLFLLGMQENYWEVTQAIFPGLMLLKVLTGLVLYKREQPISLK